MAGSKNSLSSYLRKRRIQAGLTQSQVANKLGYTSPQFVSNWERRLATPPLDAIRKLVPILDLDRDLVVDFYIQRTALILRSVLKPNSK